MEQELDEESFLARLKGAVVDVEPSSEDETLERALNQAFGKTEPMPDKDDPARYVWAYKNMPLYCFLPQSELDIFCSMIERLVSASYEKKTSDGTVARNEYGKRKYDDPLDEYEARHDELRDIVRAELGAHEDVQRLQLLDELRIISIYRSIEIARNQKIQDIFPNLNHQKLHQITYLRQCVPYWNDVFGLDQVEELRVINNCIKHSGIISRQLEGYNEQWIGKAGSRFHEYLDDASLVSPQRPLRDAYHRIAPYVGAYWNHFVELTSAFKKIS